MDIYIHICLKESLITNDPKSYRIKRIEMQRTMYITNKRGMKFDLHTELMCMQ